MTEPNTRPVVVDGGDFFLLAAAVPGAACDESFAVYSPGPDGELVGFLKRWPGPGWQAGWIERLTDPTRPAFFPLGSYPTLTEGALALVEVAKP